MSAPSGSVVQSIPGSGRLRAAVAISPASVSKPTPFSAQTSAERAASSAAEIDAVPLENRNRARHRAGDLGDGCLGRDIHGSSSSATESTRRPPVRCDLSHVADRRRAC